MFTTPCFIRKNTPSILEYLTSLGYKNDYYPYSKGNTIRCHVFGNKARFQTFGNFEADADIRLENESIDCGNNEELFKAIAALQDDSDYMQWFTSKIGIWWVLCKDETFAVDSVQAKDFNYTKQPLHKATIKELIEHFK